MGARLTQVFLFFCDITLWGFCDITLWGGSLGRLLHEGQQWRRRGAADDAHRAAHAVCLPMLGSLLQTCTVYHVWAPVIRRSATARAQCC